MHPITHALKTKGASRSALRLVIAITAALSLVACASTPKVAPELALQSAEQAIGSAEQARAARSAAAELSEARAKLAAAHDAVDQNDMLLAERLAVESRVDAELAIAKTEAIKAKEINDEMHESTKTLNIEMQRKSGAVK